MKHPSQKPSQNIISFLRLTYTCLRPTIIQQIAMCDFFGEALFFDCFIFQTFESLFPANGHPRLNHHVMS